MTDAIDICPDCGEEGEYRGDVPTNTGPTAVDPGYVEAWECEACGAKWTA